MRTLLLTLLACSPLASAQNVLVVLIDDLGVDMVGAYAEGVDPPPTPTLDALADEGVLFRNAWANPVCSPTRATLLTGRYGLRTGITQVTAPVGPALSYEEVLLPELLEPAGVATAAIGKWHLSNNASGGLLAPNLHGFGHFAGLAIGIGNLLGPWNYELWPHTVNGTTRVVTQYATTQNVDDSLRFIAGEDGPWFCYLAFNAAHTPFHAPPTALHTYDLSGLDPVQDALPHYQAAVQALDTELGRLLQTLEPEVRAQTTVVVVGDNGTVPQASLPPFEPSHSKGSLYEGGINVPLIVSGAGVSAPGREVQALVNTVDVYSTVLDLLQVQAPDELLLDSVSLAPYLASPLTLPQRSFAFAELRPNQSESSSIASLQGAPGRPPIGGGGSLAPVLYLTPGFALRDATHKLLRHLNGKEELYNLVLDPYEQLNLLALGSLSGLAAAKYDSLSAQLDALLASAE